MTPDARSEQIQFLLGTGRFLCFDFLPWKTLLYISGHNWGQGGPGQSCFIRRSVLNRESFTVPWCPTPSLGRILLVQLGESLQFWQRL